MNAEDIDYCRKRAVQERELARPSVNRDIAKIHLNQAHKYDALTDQAGQNRTLVRG